MKGKIFSLPFFSVLLCASSFPVFADEPKQRHGATLTGLNTGLTMTWQQPLKNHPNGELLASLDTLATHRAGKGIWSLYVEGSTSPYRAGVSAIISEANADAGTALDHNGKGRFQVSELHYSQTIAGSYLTLGLINPAGFIDNSHLANDETSQFLAAPLVNNATLAMPDYTLGAALHNEPSSGTPGFTLLLTSSHGLADNPEHSAGELVDIDASGKGLFSALEAYWKQASRRMLVGVWHSSARHKRIGKTSTESNQGIYALIEGEANDTLWMLRAGIANPNVSNASAFLAAAIERPFQYLSNIAVGLGIAYTEASPKLTDNSANSLRIETYLRHDVSKQWHVTPSLQWIQHPGLSSDTADIDDPKIGRAHV